MSARRPESTRGTERERAGEGEAQPEQRVAAAEEAACGGTQRDAGGDATAARWEINCLVVAGTARRPRYPKQPLAEVDASQTLVDPTHADFTPFALREGACRALPVRTEVQSARKLCTAQSQKSQSA